MEFALIFPVFIFMVFFMLDAGRYLTVQMALNNAAQVGAREVAVSADPTAASNLILAGLPDSIVRLSTLDTSSTAAGVNVGQYVCPLNSEKYQSVDVMTGLPAANPDGNCFNIADPLYSSISCTSVGTNFRAMGVAALTFKWITPLGLLVNLASPDEFGPNGSIYFNRNDSDTTMIEGKAKLLCQN